MIYPVAVIHLFLEARQNLPRGYTFTGTGESIQTDTAGKVVQHVTGATITATQIAVEQIGAP
jgi:hypothetical protein